MLVAQCRCQLELTDLVYLADVQLFYCRVFAEFPQNPTITPTHHQHLQGKERYFMTATFLLNVITMCSCLHIKNTITTRELPF